MTLRGASWAPFAAVAVALGVLTTAPLAAPLTVPLAAQAGPIPALAPPGRAGGPWITIGDDGTRFHARAEFAEWAAGEAQRAAAIRDAVAALVGARPARDVTVLVDDPRNVANGNAISWLDAPQITLYPVPPGPRSQIGRSRDWGELLHVHEVAHVAHLARARRGATGWRDRLLGALPGRFGPVTASPRWVREGYATLVEGRLTGSGRPHSPLRAAVLRTWAVSGRLPTYGGLDGGPRWQDGGFAYLAGSAFLEHLVAIHGDSALPQLWRRLAGRRARSFGAAFEETFGERPDDAWARYAAALTADAVLLERALDSVGRVRGDLVARLARGTGDPALSPDGTLVALVPETPAGVPQPLVVWSTDTGTDAARDSARRAADRRRAAYDPGEPPPAPRIPRGRRARYTLPQEAGAPFAAPRWFADGTRLLVIRADIRPDGAVRPDVFAWTPATGAVRRITDGAAIREAEPLPGDTLAVGVRCLAGRCDLVRIRLADGAVSTLVAGDAVTPYARPRAAPDGRTVVASQQWRGHWRPVLVDVATGRVTPVGGEVPYDRYDATFTRDGRALLLVSEADGVPQVVRQPLAGGPSVPLTRVFSAAFAPEPFPGDSALYFLRLDAGGEELRRLAVAERGVAPLPPALAARMRDAARGAVVRQPPPERAPAALTGEDDTAGRNDVTTDGYGLGPQRPTLLPLGAAGVDGGSVGGALGSADPVGRFGWLLLGLASDDPRAEVGGALRATWRGPVAGRGVTIETELVRARLAVGAPETPVAQRPFTRDDVFAETVGRWSGGILAATVARDGLRGRSALRIGGGVHDLRLEAPQRGEFAPTIVPNVPPATRAGGRRTHLFADVQRTHTLRHGARVLTADLRAHVSRSDGHPALHVGTYGPGAQVGTDDRQTPAPDAVTRAIARADVSARLGGPLRLAWQGVGGTVSRDAPAGEAFALGGVPAMLVGGLALPQRIAVPWLAAGELSGRDVALHTLRLATTAPVTPFASAVRADGTWRRAAGLDARFSALADPFHRLPGIDATGGIAYLLDGPAADRVRAWIGIGYRP